MSEYLSFQQVMGELGISEEDLQRMVSEGRLRAHRSGKRMVFRAEDVRDLIERLCWPLPDPASEECKLLDGVDFVDEGGDEVAQPAEEECAPSWEIPQSAPDAPGSADPIEVVRARRDAKRRFGKYVIVDRLGAGGMGEVYRAWDETLGRWAAIKIMRPSGPSGEGPDDEALARFQREARGAARLSHPNIVQVYEAGRQEGTWFIALEYVQGRSLRDWLDRAAPITREGVAERLSLFRQACRGLAAAHAAGIVHRDLKPENMLVEGGPDGPTLKIADFGICKMLASSTELTAAGQPLGTWPYMSPEQAMGRIGELGPASDVFAMGTILYEMTTGQCPFLRESVGLIAIAIIEGTPAQPRSLNAAIPRELEEVILRCLRKRPSDRYADASALGRAIDALHAIPLPMPIAPASSGSECAGRCGLCGASFSVDRSLADQTVECPGCHKILMVPSLSVAPAEVPTDREQYNRAGASGQVAPDASLRGPVEMTAAEAASMLSWWTPDPPHPEPAIRGAGGQATNDTAARLTVSMGGRLQGTVVLDDGQIMVVGRSSDSYVVLAGKGVSRQHCGIMSVDGRHMLRDLGSSNGTLVNGTRIEGPVYLEDGAKIQVGDYVLAYARDGASQPPTSDAAARDDAPPSPLPRSAPDHPAVAAPESSSDAHVFVDDTPPADSSEPDSARIFRCGACGGTFTVDSALAGHVVNCPSCGGTVRLPRHIDEGG